MANILLEHSHTRSLTYCLWLLSCYNTRRVSRDYIANTAYIYVAFHKKSLLISDVNEKKAEGGIKITSSAKNHFINLLA